MVENAVEWRKTLAGKSCRKWCRLSDRIGGMGSDRIVDWERDHRTEPRLGIRESLEKRKAIMAKLVSDRSITTEGANI